MITFRAAWLMIGLLVAGCAASGPQSRSSESTRIERAGDDLEEARARLELVRAERAVDERRWEQAQRLAEHVYESGHFRVESGLVLARALGQLNRHRRRLEVYEELREAEADGVVVEQDYLDALIAALSDYSWREAERRLEIRLEIARRAPDHPDGSAEQLRGELEYLAQNHHRQGEWEELLEVLESLRWMAGEDTIRAGSGQHLRMEMTYITALEGVGQTRRARRVFEARMQQASADGRTDDLLVLSDFAYRRGDRQAAVDGLRTALGGDADDPTEERARAHLRLAEVLIDSPDHHDQQEGADHLVYGFEIAVLLPGGHAGYGQPAHIAREARRIAAEHGLMDIEAELRVRSLQEGLLRDRAVGALVRSLAQRGDSERLREVLEIYLEGGSYQTALQWLRQASQWELALEIAERGPRGGVRQPQDWLSLAEFAFEAGETDRAHEVVGRYLDNAAGVYGQLRWSIELLLRHASVDQTVETVESAWRRQPERSDIIIELVRVLVDHGRGDRVHSVIAEAVEADVLTPAELGQLAETAAGVLDADQVYEFFEQAGRGGHGASLMRAATIAASMPDKTRYERLVDFGLYQRLPSYHLENLYHQTAHSLDAEQRTTLLEHLVRSSVHRGDYRAQLADAYLEQERTDEALSLWEGAEVDFVPITSALVADEQSLRLVEHFEQSGRAESASASLLFAVAEHYYGLWRAKYHSAEADRYRSRAVELYARVLAMSVEERSTNFRRAATLFSQRKLPKLAERAYVAGIVLGGGGPGSQRRSPWYEYGIFLLNQGRADTAKHVLGRYVSMAPSRGQVAASVAEQFAGAGFSEHAEHFYGIALAYSKHRDHQEAGHQQVLAQAGGGLAEIFLRSGRLEEFLELTADVDIERQGGHGAVDLDGLSQRGMWEPYVERLERVVDVDANLDPISYGHALWYQGRFDEAWRQFDEHLGGRDEGDAYRWLNVGRFLETRGGDKYAATAYDRAVRGTYSHHKNAALVARGRFLLRKGHIEAAVQDYLAAHKAHPNQHVFNEMLSDFDSVGHRHTALEAARADGSPFEKLAEAMLDSQLGDAPGEELAREVWSQIGSGINLFEAARTLRRAGRGDALGEFIEIAIDDGNVDAAVKLATEFEDVLVEHEELAPLLEELSRRRYEAHSTEIDNLMLRAHLRRGDYERAQAFIEAGSSKRPPDVQTLLALRFDGRFPSRVPRGSRRDAWTESATAAPVDLLRLGGARGLSAVEAFRGMPSAAPYRSPQVRVSALLHREGSADVFALLRSAAEALADGEGVTTGPIRTAPALVRGLQVMVAAGYADEVAALLDEFPEPVRSMGVVESFSARLAARSAADEPGAEGAGSTDERFESVQELHKTVNRLLSDGQSAAAARLLEDQYADLTRRRKTPEGAWIPSTLESRKAMLRVTLRVHAASGNHDGAAEVIERWRADVGADNLMMSPLVGALADAGFDSEAARVSQQLAQTYATSATLEQAVRAAVTDGDTEALEDLLPRYRRISGRAGGIAGQLEAFMAGSEPATAEVLVDHALQAGPMAVGARVAQIRVAFRALQMERGRELLGRYADDYAGSSEAIERLVSELADSGYFVEVARVLAAHLDEQPVSAQTLETIGRANIELGLESEGVDRLRAAAKKQGDAEAARARLVRQLVVDGHLEAAKSLLGSPLEAGAGLDATYLARGLARLAGGDEHAQADLQRGLARRRGEAQVLADVALVALRAGQMELAERYVMDLARLPYRVQFGRHPLKRAIEVAKEAGQSRWLVAVFDRQVPSLLANPMMVAELNWVLTLGGLLSEAGLRERADDWYEQAFAMAALVDEDTFAVAPILEARAFNLARHGDAEQAEVLARRAISTAASAQPAYFATLALALYNQGELSAARQTARRALRRGYPFPHHLVASGGLDENLEAVLIQGRAGYEKTWFQGMSPWKGSNAGGHPGVSSHYRHHTLPNQIQIRRF
jgi:tetratricopeptide (TPR) repeat protein